MVPWELTHFCESDTNFSTVPSCLPQYSTMEIKIQCEISPLSGVFNVDFRGAKQYLNYGGYKK